jgi:adenine phosphoribosyltransferase
MNAPIEGAREAVLREFAWIDGHADVWRLAEDPPTFAAVTAGLAAIASSLSPTAVVGIETRGVLFGAPVAHALGLGFHTMRKHDGLFAGSTDFAESIPDYRDRTYTVRTRAHFGPGDRIVMIDDWVERGSQARAVRALVERAGAEFVALIVIVDESDRTLPVLSLVSGDDLPPWSGQ